MIKPVVTYCIIAFGITWAASIIPYVLWSNGVISFNTLNVWYNAGALGPFAAAWFCSRYFYGKKGSGKLFSSFSFKNSNRTSWLIATSPLLFFVIGLIIYPLLAGEFYSFDVTREQFNLTDRISYVNWLLPFITYSFFEEFGWRGFLLPHLQQKYNALQSTVILTCIWALWHLPFFLWRFQFTPLITIGFFVSIFIGSVIITSLYNISRGNIAMVIFFHFCNNVASALDTQYIVAVVSTCFVFLAITLIKKYNPAHLAPYVRVKNFYLR